MRIEVILTENEIVQELVEAMEARDLPEKFLYWSPGPAEAWLELSRDPVFEALGVVWAGLAERAGALVKPFGKTVPVISFGAGAGSKELPLLASLQQAGREPRYFPVDASQVLLEAACSAAEDAEVETTGIKADISSPMHLVFASDAAESPRLFLMPGNVIGSFDPLDEIRHLAGCLHEGDRLIVDAELVCDDNLSRRARPATSRFVFAPLAAMGIAHEDGDVRFEEKRDERHEGLHLIQRHFQTARDTRANVCGREVLLQRGERIAMNFAYAFTPEAFSWLLEEHTGLTVLEQTRSSDGRFAAAVCARQS